MLRGGITCFSDQYFFPETVAESSVDLHMRVNVGTPIMEFPTAWAGSVGEYLAKGSELVHDASLTAIGSLNLSADTSWLTSPTCGDGWGHDITVECTDGVPVEKRYPRIIERFNPSPPQCIYDEEDWDEDSD